MAISVRNYFRLLSEDKIQSPSSKVIYPLLEGLSKAYGKVSSHCRGQYDGKTKKKEKLPFPVISVGNLTWGGTGKTPFVEYLARRVSEMHKIPLILSRGYSHDEIEQYKDHLPRVLLGVGKDRAKTGREMGKKNRIDTAILDDGFQHWKLERNLDIVLVNSICPFGNGKLIPRGPLREPVEAIVRAGIIVLTHTNLVKADILRNLKKKISDLAPKSLIVESHLEPLFFYRAKKKQRVPIEKMLDRKVTTFSAIGAPRSFQLMLSNLKVKPIRNFEFSDHYVFSKKDLREIKVMKEASASDDVVTTEKDFYRAPKEISEILDPLVLATRLRIASGEKALMDCVSKVVGNPR